MYDPPVYLWAITIACVAGMPAATCLVLYGGAARAGLSRTRAALLAGGAAAVLGGWFTATVVIAGHGWYHARLGHQVPWMPVAVVSFLGLLLALGRIPVVARTLAAPGTVSRLELPHFFRLEGVAFLIMMALGHLPALIALRLARGTGRRAALWLNAFGMTDLIVALVLGALTGYQLISTSPTGAPISELPLVLVPTAGVPLLFALHITSVSALRKTPRTQPAAGARTTDLTPRTAAAQAPASHAQ